MIGPECGGHALVYMSAGRLLGCLLEVGVQGQGGFFGYKHSTLQYQRPPFDEGLPGRTGWRSSLHDGHSDWYGCHDVVVPPFHPSRRFIRWVLVSEQARACVVCCDRISDHCKNNQHAAKPVVSFSFACALTGPQSLGKQLEGASELVGGQQCGVEL
jgi:hypothetical protein